MIFPSSRGSQEWYVAYITRPATQTNETSRIVVGRLTNSALRRK
jgi:hypothetical protein